MNALVSSASADDLAKAYRAILAPGLELGAYPAFLRVLLTTDGTVTKSLEAFFWEKVKVEPLLQEDLVLREPLPAIDREVGDSVLLRCVQLRGQASDIIYARARSLICIDILPEGFQRDLRAQRLGIGELLRECGLETYREILEIGHDTETGEVWRCYRIVMDQRPFIQITERFALTNFIAD